MSAKIKRGVKEWAVLLTEGGFTDAHSGVSGVRSDITPEADDILIDDRGQELRIMTASPSDPGWYTVFWRTY